MLLTFVIQLSRLKVKIYEIVSKQYLVTKLLQKHMNYKNKSESYGRASLSQHGPFQCLIRLRATKYFLVQWLVLLVAIC